MQRFAQLIVIACVLAGCDAFARYSPTPIAVVITAVPSTTPVPTTTPTAVPTVTATATATTDFAPTATTFPCDTTDGQTITFNDNFSEIAQENIRYLVYVPPCYFQLQRRYPVVYLMHGLSYREQQFQDIGIEGVLNSGIRGGTLAPMIVVMPYLGTLGQVDAYPPDPSYERVLLEELLPRIEKNFCTINDRVHRAIGGISRGGFWAYSVAMRNPTLFQKVGGHSAYFPDDTISIPAEFNPLELATSSPLLLDPATALTMYLDNGASDPGGRSEAFFSGRLAARNIAHTYIVNPIGEHNNDYWQAHISDYMTFYNEGWERRFDALPSCNEPSP